MSESWLPILGLLFFGYFIWWITTGKGYWSRLARSSREPASPKLKAVLWIAYAATALWVLANSSCEGSGELGQQQEQEPGQHAQE